MTGILVTIALYAVLGYAAWQYTLSPAIKSGKKGDNNAVYIIAVIAAAFIARVICAVMYRGHDTDMSCFTAWSDMIFKDGISSFYTSASFHDYPPGYMYILYIIGAVKSLFNPQEGALYLLIKFPSIVIDLLSGIFIYKLAKKKFSDAVSAIFAALYVFNPAVILNSSLWGQVDTVYTILAVLMIYFISEKRMIPSYFIFALCIFVKPQAFIFTPLIIYGIIENVFLPKFNKDAFFKNLLWGLCAIAALVIIALPFGLNNVIGQYTATLASYPYKTINAFNFWCAFGQNWVGLTTASNIAGYAALVLIVAYCTYIFFKSKSKGKYFFIGALLSVSTFMLSVKMHERYAFPAMLLLLMAFMTTENIHEYVFYGIASLSQFFASAWVLFIYQQDINKYFKSPVTIVASFINIAIFVYMIYIAQKYYLNNATVNNTVSAVKNKNVRANTANNAKRQNNQKPVKENKIAVSKVFKKITKFDIIAIIAVTAVYSCFALYDLGDMHAPQTDIELAASPVTIDLGQSKYVQKIKFYLGSYELNENRSLDMEFKDENGNAVMRKNLTDGSVFYWSEENIAENARYITLSTNGEHLTIKEFAVMDNADGYVMPSNASDSSILALFDEQRYIPERTSFRNSTYFDEIYHARTAYEFVHHLSVYEWTHPPLGKVFISLGILIFGMCPFGWRIAGTLFGIFMIPFMYLFAKRLTNKSWLALVTCVLFTFDFMHFAQTRIATIDVYITTFVILMYYFMYKYYAVSFYDTPFKKTLVPLALSGVCMGLGIASKWTGIYAGAGLAVIFFIVMYRRYAEYLYALKNPKGETNGIQHSFITENFKPYFIKTILWCCIFFVLVPAAIYCLSYIPYLQAPDAHGFKTIIENQQNIFTYHSKTVLGSTHPYSSVWYEWIIMKRPIWYYSGTISDTVKEGISSFGNPLVWWIGIPAFLYMIYAAFAKRNKTAAFLAIGYIANLIFWIPITRLTFIYHYFPMVPFIALMIGYSVNLIYKSAKDDKNELTLKTIGKIKFGTKQSVIVGAFIYAALAVILFVMFYPVLAGHPVSVNYVTKFLKWFSSWVLI